MPNGNGRCIYHKDVQMLPHKRVAPSLEYPGRWAELRGYKCPKCDYWTFSGDETLISEGEARRRNLPTFERM